MLVLSRKPGEKLVIGNNITVTVVEVVGNKVRLALDAPPQVRILRAELLEASTPTKTSSSESKREIGPPSRGEVEADSYLEIVSNR